MPPPGSVVRLSRHELWMTAELPFALIYKQLLKNTSTRLL